MMRQKSQTRQTIIEEAIVYFLALRINSSVLDRLALVDASIPQLLHPLPLR